MKIIIVIAVALFLSACATLPGGVGGGSGSLPLKATCKPHHHSGHHNEIVVRVTNKTAHTITLLHYTTRIMNSNGETIDEVATNLTHPRVITAGHRRVVHFWDKLLGTPTSCTVTDETTGT